MQRCNRGVIVKVLVGRFEGTWFLERGGMIEAVRARARSKGENKRDDGGGV